MTTKSRLNELCQENEWPLPDYTTVLFSGPPRDPFFKSTVKFDSLTMTGYGSSMLAAQEIAAINLYERLSNYGRPRINVEEKKVSPGCVREVYMIDGENLSSLADNMPFTDNRQIIIYFSKNHHMEHMNIPVHVIKRTSPCTRANGCNIFMAMDIMTIMDTYPLTEKIVIFTKNSFASAVVDNFQDFWDGITVEHLTHYP